MLTCTIEWNQLSLPIWQKLFQTVKHSTILQDYQYGIAHCHVNKQSARWGLILINGQQAGLIQILEAKTLFGLLHAVILDRGPLWFDGFGSAIHVAAFFKELNRQFPQRWGRKRRIIPEVETSTAFYQIMQQNGFSYRKNSQYSTLWWDIHKKSDDLYNNLSNSFQKSLKKAQKSNIEIEFDWNLAFLNKFKAHYAVQQIEKCYSNISLKLLDTLAMLSPESGNILIVKAVKQQGQHAECIASQLYLLHGQCATYQIGWTSEAGRQYCAHHLMLWQTRTLLNEKNITAIDLGGIDHENSGLAKFKTGTGAKVIHLAGQYA